MYSKRALATPGCWLYLPMLSLARLMKGPSDWDNMLAVPSLTKRPLVALTGLAVLAVLGVLRACSMVPGLEDWVPGLDTPLRGLPDPVLGLNAWLTPDQYVSEVENYFTIHTLTSFWSIGCPERCPRSGDCSDSVIIQNNINNTLLISLNITHVHLLSESSGLETPDLLIIGVLIQYLGATFNTLLISTVW